MSDRQASLIGVIAGRLLVCVAGTLSVAAFFRHQLADGFTMLFGDRFDGLIETTILEHWFNVLCGREPWNTARFFFPTAGTLAYNDAYLVFGLIYTPFRLAELDMLLSGELVNVCVKAIGYASFYLLSRISYGASRTFSALGGVLFTLSCTSFEQAFHVQLLSVAFAPLLMLLFERHVASLATHPRAAAWWGCLAAVTLDLWLMTSFYMAWFTVLLIGTGVLLAVGGCLVAGWRVPAGFSTKRLWPSAIALLVFAVGTLPFLALYLPKAAETGGHPWAETLSYLPGLLDIVNVGPGNLVFGWVDAAINHAVRPGFPVHGEHTVGLPPALLTLFALSLFGVRRRGPLAVLTSLSCLLVWTLALHVGQATLWHAVYDLVPGAKAVRVVSRIQILLVVPVILAVTAYLASLSRRLPAPLLLALCALLVLEEVDTAPMTGLDRPAEVRQIASIPAPPAGCQVFYASTSRPGPALYSDEVDSTYSINVDSMLLAERLGLSTINGMASFVPPGWSLGATNRPDYLDRVQAYLARNHIEHACALDLKHATWN